MSASEKIISFENAHERFEEVLSNSSADAHNFIKKLESAANSFTQWNICVRLWLQLKEPSNTDKSLQRLCSYATTHTDHFGVAEVAWLVSMEQQSQEQQFNKQLAQLHLAKAVEKAVELSELLQCAEFRIIMGYSDDAFSMIQSAESLAKTSRQWVDIARIWLELPNKEKAKICAVRAGELADEWLDYLHCVSLWKELEDDQEVARFNILANNSKPMT